MKNINMYCFSFGFSVSKTDDTSIVNFKPIIGINGI